MAVSLLERSLLASLEQTRAQLTAEQAEVRRLHLDLELCQSRLKVAQVEVSALSEVVARDRKRVEAETAVLAARVAEASTLHNS